MSYVANLKFITFIIICITLIGCGSTPTQQSTQTTATETIETSPQFELGNFTLKSGNPLGWYKRIYSINDPDLEFVRVFPDQPVSLRLVQNTSLDQIKNATFWGYALRYKPRDRYLPIYGQLEADGIDRNTDQSVRIQYNGYFKLHNFKEETKNEALSLKFANASLTGFAGERTVEGMTKAVFSNLVTNANECEWQYDFWNSKRRFLGTRYDQLLSFHAEPGLKHNLNTETWTLYTQMPKDIILDLESPSETIFTNLFKSINELPKVKYNRRNFSPDYIECLNAHTYDAAKIGDNQHRYSIYYPRLTTFGIF